MKFICSININKPISEVENNFEASELYLKKDFMGCCMK